MQKRRLLTIASWLLAAFWLLLSISYFFYYIGLKPSVCAGDKDVYFCQFYMANHAVHTVLFSLAFLGLGAIFLGRKFWRISLLSIAAFPLLSFSARIVDAYTLPASSYSYEWFFMAFGLWDVWLLLTLLAALLYVWRVRYVLFSTLVATLLFTYMAVAAGRGSFEHVSFLSGGVLANVSWDMIMLSQLVWMWILIAGLLLVSALVRAITHWIKQGRLGVPGAFRLVAYYITLCLVTSISLVSVPWGLSLHYSDVNQAQNYLDYIGEIARKEFVGQGEYPKDIVEFEPKNIEKPRLIKRHDYAVGVDGAYYFSRPDFYCVLFHDPGVSQGYYSRTSKRGWRLSHKGKSLGQNFEAICDAQMPTENLVAEHLGLMGVDDPVAYGQYLTGGGPLRSATSPSATMELNEKLETMRNEHPEMFEEAKPAVQSEVPPSTVSEPVDIEDTMVSVEEAVEQDEQERKRKAAESMKRIQEMMKTAPVQAAP